MMANNEKVEMTVGMRALALVIFVAVVGLFIGLFGLIAHQEAAQTIGWISLIVLAVLLWASAELFGHRTMSRLLGGVTKKAEDGNGA